MNEQLTQLARQETSRPSWREWLLFVLQALLVAGIEVSDDIIRGVFVPRSPELPQANAARVMEFEHSHNFWIEPGIQRYVENAHSVLGLPIRWDDLVPVANTVYGLSHGLVTLLFAIWLYWRRRLLFPFVRNVFLFTTALSVLLYNVFPLAPPRLATGLFYDGRPFHFVDTVFESGGVRVGFDRFAAMPSLHVAWALIVGITIAWAARPLAVRLLGLAHPVVMFTAVIVTANHYIVDCLGALAVTGVALGLALLVRRWQRNRAFKTQQADRRDMSPAPAHGTYGRSPSP